MGHKVSIVALCTDKGKNLTPGFFVFGYCCKFLSRRIFYVPALPMFML